MKQTVIDGKPVIYFNNRKTVPPVRYVKQVYRSIPDNKNVPIMFMTRRQYLEQYITNQEKATGKKFTAQEKQRYIQEEMRNYRNILSRYTTQKNPYFPPAVVFFNDSKIKDFKDCAEHEYGHEYAEKNNIIHRDEEQVAENWRKIKKQRNAFNPIGRILGRRL